MEIHSVNYSKNNLVRVVPFFTSNNELCNSIIDDGSTVNFIERKLRDRLTNLPSKMVQCEVTGINNSTQKIHNEEVLVPIFNYNGDRFIVEAIVIDSINSDIALPDIKSLKERFPELNTIDFPDLAEKHVEMLFGVSSPEIIAAQRSDIIIQGGPTIRFTTMGPALGFAEKQKERPHVLLVENKESSNIDTSLKRLNDDSTYNIVRLIEKFINEDTIVSPPERRLQSPLDEALEAKIRKDFHKTEDGHLECGLPWINQTCQLKCNYKECVNFDRIQKQRILKKSQDYWQHCINEIEKQVEYGAARVLGEDEDKLDGFYHPIQLVLKPSKSTPIRCCLDAARPFLQKDGSRKNFNSQIHACGNHLNNLEDLLILFRVAKVCLTADLMKMFLNIRVNKDERKFLRFIFNEVVYEATSIPFGLKCSPSIASLGLKICAEKAWEAGEISQRTLKFINSQM